MMTQTAIYQAEQIALGATRSNKLELTTVHPTFELNSPIWK